MMLYKYLAPERIDILEKKQIRFTQPKYLNDHYEALPLIQQVMTSDWFETHLKGEIGTAEGIDIAATIKEAAPTLSRIEIDNIIDTLSIKTLVSEIYPIVINYVKEIMTAQNSGWMTEASKKFKESASNRIGVLSLSEIYNGQTMWAHYANESKGFVIAFDTENSFFNQRITDSDQIRFIRPVTYSTERPVWPVLDEHLAENDFSIAVHKILLTKHADWEKEKEWRMIMPLDKCETVIDNEIYLLQLPPKCIKEVILGLNIEHNTKERIITLIKAEPEYSHVKIYQGFITEGYSISLMPIL